MPLKEKLKKLQETKKNKVNWDELKHEWIKDVENFYENVQKWLSELKEEGLLTMNFSPVTVSEENIGTYTINQMEIKIDDIRDIILEPIGRDIIGSDGRIDGYERGNISKGDMILCFKGKNSVKWHFINKQSRHKGDLMTKESFEERLEEWLEL